MSDLLYLEEGNDAEENKLWKPQPQSEIDNPQNLYQLVRMAWDNDRIEDLLAMIEEYENEVYGITIEEAIRAHNTWADEFLESWKRRKITDE
jgi:hypothetical protein